MNFNIHWCSVPLISEKIVGIRTATKKKFGKRGANSDESEIRLNSHFSLFFHVFVLKTSERIFEHFKVDPNIKF